jgi:hypothetical protein
MPAVAETWSIESCAASGWQMHPSCADQVGAVICPACTQTVATAPDAILGRRVCVIQDHPRPTTR